MSGEKMEKLDGKSTNIVEQNIEQLKELFPSVFSEGKIQFNKLEELLGNYVIDDEDHYNFTWHGKRKAGRLAQTPSTGTLRPCKDESVDWDNTENLFIEGDNLEVLKLLQKSYHRQVKMIYIDPPYNTGNDFVYEDDFKDGVKNYLEMTGQLDGEGKKMGTNSSAAGRYHTNWLNMMYPRLRLARNLLKDDGVIFISIDDTECPNLRKIVDEVFGEVNFITQISWERAYAPINLKHHFSPNHDHILCYANSVNHLEKFTQSRTAEANSRYKNSDNDMRGVWKADNLSVGPAMLSNVYEIITPSGRKVMPPSGYSWRYSKDKLQELIKDNRISFGESGNNVPAIKRFLNEVKDGITPMTVWKYSEVGHTQDARKETKDLFDGQALFDYPKPVKLIKKIIDIAASDKSSVVMDFFAGSATTAHAVMQLNAEDKGKRKHISVQLPEKTDEKSEAFKAGYTNIADISKERIRRAGKKIKEENPDYNGDLGFKVFKLDSSNIKRWDADFDTLENDLLNAVDYLVKDRTDEDVLYELCLKLGLDLSIKIEEKTIAGKKLFILGRGYLVVCLDDAITMDLVNGIGALKDELAPEDGMRVVFKDDGFKDDVVKTNALQTLKRFGIDDIKSL